MDSSVKKLFILAIVKGIPETYENLKSILDALKLKKRKKSLKLDFCLATDLKLQNIATGIQSGSSTYPCAYCESARPFTKAGKLRSLGRLRKLAEEFRKNSGDKKDAKDYMNVINAPLFEGDDSTLIIDILPIPELHIHIGVGKSKKPQSIPSLHVFCTQKIEMSFFFS